MYQRCDCWPHLFLQPRRPHDKPNNYWRFCHFCNQWQDSPPYHHVRSSPSRVPSSKTLSLFCILDRCSGSLRQTKQAWEVFSPQPMLHFHSCGNWNRRPSTVHFLRGHFTTSNKWLDKLSHSATYSNVAVQWRNDVVMGVIGNTTSPSNSYL